MLKKQSPVVAPMLILEARRGAITVTFNYMFITDNDISVDRYPHPLYTTSVNEYQCLEVPSGFFHLIFEGEDREYFSVTDLIGVCNRDSVVVWAAGESMRYFIQFSIDEGEFPGEGTKGYVSSEYTSLSFEVYFDDFSEVVD